MSSSVESPDADRARPPAPSEDPRATSRSLLARVRANEPGAWDRLVALYAPFVFHHCRRARLSPEDSADVFQEVFQAAFAKLASFEKRGPNDTFRGWLGTIARNKATDLQRRQVHQPRAVGGTEMHLRLARIEDSTPAEPETDEERAELQLFQSALEDIRHQFHDTTWRAFLGTVVDGRPPADVGEELAMSPGAVRVAKSRVLQRLRAELGDVPPG